MAEITKKVLQLGFRTVSGASVKLTINKPNEDLEAADISSAMNAIIASQALGEEQVVESKEEAKYIIQEEEAITLS